MWTYINLENYLVNAILTEYGIDFMCTNLKDIWRTEMSRQNILELFRELNPLFDIQDESIIAKTLELYSRADGANHLVTIDNLALKLNSTSFIGKFSYTFNVNMSVADNQLFFTHWTIPVLASLHSMQNREQKLIDMICSKDLEIEQYKEEGAELKRSRYGQKQHIIWLEQFLIRDTIALDPSFINVYYNFAEGVITAPFSREAFEASEEESKIVTSPASLVCGQLQQHLNKFMIQKKTDTVKPDAPSKRMVPDQPSVPSISLLSSGPTGPKKSKGMSRLRL